MRGRRRGLDVVGKNQEPKSGLTLKVARMQAVERETTVLEGKRQASTGATNGSLHTTASTHSAMALTGLDTAIAFTPTDIVPNLTAVFLFPSSSSMTKKTFAASLAVTRSSTTTTTLTTTPASTTLTTTSISPSTIRSAATTSLATNFSYALTSVSLAPPPPTDANTCDGVDETEKRRRR